MTEAAATALCAEINEALAACVAANVSHRHKYMIWELERLKNNVRLKQVVQI